LHFKKAIFALQNLTILHFKKWMPKEKILVPEVLSTLLSAAAKRVADQTECLQLAYFR